MVRKDVKNKLKEYFFLNPTVKLRVRQIEKELQLPLPSVIRYTKELEKEGILQSEIIAKIRLYSADRISKKYLLEKKLFNIKWLFNSGLIEFLIDKSNNPQIILFGSYSKGEDIEKSDVDIYIQTPKKMDINLKPFEDKLNRTIQLFNYKNFKEIKNKELINNILNGIVLNGFIEVFS